MISEHVALVQTVDFFTPIVDDPFDFGRIAATNAISDVYAMGGTPLTALNIAAFPEDLDLDILARILEGGAAVARDAGVAILGGHTIKDAEPKYGMAVTGTVDPRRIVTNATREAGRPARADQAARYRHSHHGAQARRDSARRSRRSDPLDDDAERHRARAMLAAGAHAATDVTGFGLLGHGENGARVGRRTR